MSQLQEKILETAYTLFLENGYENTTTREIAEKAGIERGHLFYYYRKKKDILLDWFHRFLKGVYSAVKDSAPEEQDGIVMTALLEMVYYKTIAEDPRLLQILVTILQNSDLRREKVNFAFELYRDVMEEYHGSYDEREIYIGACVSIGAEAELFLNMMDHTLDMEYPEFVERIINIHLDTFDLPPGEKKEALKKANEYLKKFDDSDLLKLTQVVSTVQI